MGNEIVTFEDIFSNGLTGRHETFTPRYGWLKKGFDRCISNPHVFNDDTSIEQLGVGKNMVRSIRFWCLLFNLLKKDSKPGFLKPTAFGKQLLDTEKGWDPYLEDPASLWLLHWQIFKPPFQAVSWNIAFSYVTLTSFTPQELADFIYKKFKEYSGKPNFSKSSLLKDASCIIRMYSSRTREKTDIHCPFNDLELIVPASFKHQKTDYYRFSNGPKKTLPDLIFMASVFEYASIWYPEQKSLSLSLINFGPNSPGMVFRLSETDCGQRIERVSRYMSNFLFTETNGIRQIQFSEQPEKLSWDCISQYYRELR
jgi:hypothetical protein